MTERPILFSGPMVRAILEGRKTMTRRVIDFDRTSSRVGQSRDCFGPDGYDTVTDKQIKRVPWTANRISQFLNCPYGGPGDRLWVRETWGCDPNDWGAGPEYCKGLLVYKASWPDDYVTIQHGKGGGVSQASGEYHWGWRPSIHMPRWASRIDLEVVSVRVERVQEISEADIISEGVVARSEGIGDDSSANRNAFQGLWDSLNAKRGCGWDKNPWVWVIEFKRQS